MSNLQRALREVAHAVAYIQKDATNDFHKYKYASAEAVMRKVNSELWINEVAILDSKSEMLSLHWDDKGSRAVVRITWTLGAGEERATFQGVGCGYDKGDKSIMKANTAALKYLLSNAFCISWGDDPEADATTDSRAEGKAASPSNNAKQGSTTELPPPEELIKTLMSASKEMLPNLKTAVLAYRGTEAYDGLRTVYKERQNGGKEA